MKTHSTFVKDYVPPKVDILKIYGKTSEVLCSSVVLDYVVSDFEDTTREEFEW
jgi:hypothetical protein